MEVNYDDTEDSGFDIDDEPVVKEPEPETVAVIANPNDENLKAEIDDEKIESFSGTLSLPFEKSEKIAVKIIDDRGIECLRVIKL